MHVRREIDVECISLEYNVRRTPINRLDVLPQWLDLEHATDYRVVKDPTQPSKCVTGCRGRPNSEINHSCVSHRMGCLE